jgi:hypothetical protein
MRARYLPFVALAVLLAAAVALQVVRERRAPLPLPREGGAVMYVQSPAAVRRAALSFDALAADLYWIRAIQHYGGTKRSGDPNASYDQLYPLLDLTTSLDPRFNVAFRFGAIFLSEPAPNGPGRPDLAIALLEKGLTLQPHRWEYAQDIGFVHYWWRRDYKTAAEWFLRGADNGGPDWLRQLAAVTLARGGNRASSRRLWQEVLAGADEDWLIRMARQRLLQLDALDEIDGLRRMAIDYERRLQRPLESWAQLRQAGYLRDVPRDPEGYAYLLDGARGVITLAPGSPLNPLPVEPPPFEQVAR